MPNSVLPIWVQYVQALGIPIAGALITIVGAGIAYQQMRIARVKLQHDLYERRLAIFSAARDLLSEIVKNGTPSSADIAKFTIATVDAPFHFDQPVLDYLNQVEMLASTLLVDEQTLAGQTNNKELTERIRINRRWLQDQLQGKQITKVFLPYLTIDPATRL
jgi:hypothetical protein